jgi:VWFA-related protein
MTLVNRLLISGLVLAVAMGALTTGRAQNPRPTAKSDDDSIVIRRDEVPFDLVVRDKKGKLIRDLTESDVEVYEDGVKQSIQSFRFISSGVSENVSTQPGSTPATDASAPKKDTGTATEAAGVSAVALVFDRLSPESRLRARDAALSYLGQSVRKNELVGVFLTDLSVVTVQPFTYDAQQVKSGIEKFATQAPSSFPSTNEKARESRTVVTTDLLRKTLEQAQQSSGNEFLVAIANMMMNRLDFFEEMQRDQQGNATAYGLLHIAASLRSLPGRKAVIFFSEGLVLPPNVVESFRSVISEANRGGVSFYSVDVAGLRTQSKLAETRQEINSRSELRSAQLGSTTDPSGPMTKELERNEDLLRSNPETGLGQLATQTGGFLITDSNDLSGRLQKVDEDLHSYYLLSYSSNNKNYDGHFRKIEVKLKRSGLTVQSRKGYYAVNGNYGSPILPYEAPALAARDAETFPFYAGVFSFPERERLGLVPVIVDVPISAFTVRVDQSKKTYDTDFSLVTVIRNESGQVVAKLSKQYNLNGPAEKAEDEKKGRVLFYREAELPPDHYTFQAIAYDAPSGRASVKTGAFDVGPADASKVRVSDLTLLSRGEPVANDENKNNPFRIANIIVSPNLGEPLHHAMKQVPFFFTVYLPSGSAKPKVTIELITEGKVLSQIPGELPASDAVGRSQFIAALPLEKIPAGSYELKITVAGEGVSLSRSRKFTLVD